MGVPVSFSGLWVSLARDAVFAEGAQWCRVDGCDLDCGRVGGSRVPSGEYLDFDLRLMTQEFGFGRNHTECRQIRFHGHRPCAYPYAYHFRPPCAIRRRKQSQWNPRRAVKRPPFLAPGGFAVTAILHSAFCLLHSPRGGFEVALRGLTGLSAFCIHNSALASFFILHSAFAFGPFLLTGRESRRILTGSSP